MYCTQNRFYCGDCNQSVLASSYPNHLKSQGNVNKSLKNRSTNLMTIKTHTHYKK